MHQLGGLGFCLGHFEGWSGELGVTTTPPVSMARAMFLLSRGGGALARGAMFLLSKGGGPLTRLYNGITTEDMKTEDDCGHKGRRRQQTNVLLGNMIRQWHMLSRRHTTYHKLPWFRGHCQCHCQYQVAGSTPLPVKQSVQISVCLSVCLSICLCCVCVVFVSVSVSVYLGLQQSKSPN